MKKISQCLLLLLAWAMFEVRASAVAVCSVSSTTEAFGVYNTVSGGVKDTVGTISVTCTGSIGDSVNYSIALGPGGGSLVSRNMQAGGSKVNYNLFTNGTHTVIWGDGTSGTATVSDSYTLSSTSTTRSYTVYGEIAAQYSSTVGSYLDSVAITLTY